MSIDEVLRASSDSLFRPESLDDIRSRLRRIAENECSCADSAHENALHDLANDDVPVLLAAIEKLSDGDHPLSQTAAGHRLTLRECVRRGNPIEAFNHFIMAWVDPKWHAHLLDSDSNDGEWVRDAIRDVWPGH